MKTKYDTTFTQLSHNFHTQSIHHTIFHIYVRIAMAYVKKTRTWSLTVRTSLLFDCRSPAIPLLLDFDLSSLDTASDVNGLLLTCSILRPTLSAIRLTIHLSVQQGHRADAAEQRSPGRRRRADATGNGKLGESCKFTAKSISCKKSTTNAATEKSNDSEFYRRDPWTRRLPRAGYNRMGRTWRRYIQSDS